MGKINQLMAGEAPHGGPCRKRPGRAALLGCILGIPEQSAALLVAAGGRTLGKRSVRSSGNGCTPKLGFEFDTSF